MKLRVCLLLLLLIVLSGCARRLPSSSPSLPFEQHSLRVQLVLDSDGFAALAQYQPLAGRIGLRPILEAEGMWPLPSPKTTVQLLVNYGRFYVVAEGFRTVWEITPRPGTSDAAYRPAAKLADPQSTAPKSVRLSRYGPSGSSCLRIDREAGPTLYVTSEGKVDDRCP